MNISHSSNPPKKYRNLTLCTRCRQDCHWGFLRFPKTSLCRQYQHTIPSDLFEPKHVLRQKPIRWTRALLFSCLNLARVKWVISKSITNITQSQSNPDFPLNPENANFALSANLQFGNFNYSFVGCAAILCLGANYDKPYCKVTYCFRVVNARLVCNQWKSDSEIIFR